MSRPEGRAWDWFDLVENPLTGCAMPRCGERAQCLYQGEPYCLDCAERAIERACVPREYRHLFPPLEAAYV